MIIIVSFERLLSVVTNTEQSYQQFADKLFNSYNTFFERKKMSKLTLYYFEISPPSRATRLTLKALGLEAELKHINTIAKEQLAPEFVAINPQHTVPTLIDDGKVIWESHAICTYLITKYGKDDSLYPTDAYTRAQVDQRLHFDSSVLFPRFLDLVLPLGLPETVELPKVAVDKAIEAIKLLEVFLGNNHYIVGNNLTLADFSCATTAFSLVSLLPINKEQFPKVFAWIDRLNELPYNQEVNEIPFKKCLDFVNEQLEKNQAKQSQ